MARYFSRIIKVIILTLFATSAMAWEPQHPVRVTIGFAPGSGNELSFRGFSSLIEKANPKISFIVENRAGADGVVAMNEFITKPNDGYHLYVPSHQGIWVTAEYFNKQAVRYTLEDFEYVISLARSPLAVIVHEKSDVQTVPDLIKKLLTTQKPITFAAGSGAHKLAFNYMSAQVPFSRDLVKTVGYKGPAQATQDVAGGHVEFGIVPIAVAAGVAKSGKIRILALCSEEELYGFEGTPLMKTYVPGMNVYAGWGIILPKGTKKEIIDWYAKNFAAAIDSKEGQEFMRNNYMFSPKKERNPEGFKSAMTDLRKQWVPVIKQMPLD